MEKHNVEGKAAKVCSEINFVKVGNNLRVEANNSFNSHQKKKKMLIEQSMRTKVLS